MVRSIASWSSICLLSNELLFLIFEHLDFETILRAARAQRLRRRQPRARSLTSDNEKKKCHVM